MIACFQLFIAYLYHPSVTDNGGTTVTVKRVYPPSQLYHRERFRPVTAITLRTVHQTVLCLYRQRSAIDKSAYCCHTVDTLIIYCEHPCFCHCRHPCFCHCH